MSINDVNVEFRNSFEDFLSSDVDIDEEASFQDELIEDAAFQAEINEDAAFQAEQNIDEFQSLLQSSFQRKAEKNPGKRGKYTELLLAEKVRIIGEVRKTNNKTQVAKHYGLKRTTVNGLWKNREKIQSDYERGLQNRKRRKIVKSEDLEKEVMAWFYKQRQSKIPIGGDLIKEESLKIANRMGIAGFKASNGWFQKFKARNGLRFKILHGEAEAVDQNAVKEWQSNVLVHELEKYEHWNVYNLDETGSFYEALPNKTYAYKDEAVSGGKNEKKRVTVLLGSNMDGTDKLPPLVIGRFAKPRCFKQVVNLPVAYTHNVNGWMNQEIFYKYLKGWNDLVLQHEDRHVIVFLDNFGGHNIDAAELTHIVLRFLPARTTARLQPLDMGIIKNFKLHYKKRLLRDRIERLDQSRSTKVELIHALRFIKDSWDDIKQETICNCFCKAGFFKDKVEEIDEQDGLVDLIKAWEQLKLRDDISVNIQLEDYVEIDEVLYVGEQEPLENEPELEDWEDDHIPPFEFQELDEYY